MNARGVDDFRLNIGLHGRGAVSRDVGDFRCEPQDGAHFHRQAKADIVQGDEKGMLRGRNRDQGISSRDSYTRTIG